MNKRPLLPLDLPPIFFLTFGFVLLIGALAANLPDRWMLAFGEIALIVPALAYVWLKKIAIRETFRLNVTSFSVCYRTFLLFLPVFVLVDELDRLIMHYFPMPTEWLESLNELVQFTSLPDAVLLLVISSIIAPIAEEMLFRGVVQRSLEIFREPAIAMVLTSVLFAVAHFNPWTGIQLLILGMVLGYITYLTQSVFPAIFFHGLNNFFSMIIMNADATQIGWYESGGHVQWYWIVAAALAVFPAFQYFRKSIRHF